MQKISVFFLGVVLRHLLFPPHLNSHKGISPCSLLACKNSQTVPCKSCFGCPGVGIVLKELCWKTSYLQRVLHLPQEWPEPHLNSEKALLGSPSVPQNHPTSENLQLHHGSGSILSSTNMENFCRNWSWNLLILHEMSPLSPWKLYLPFDSECTRNISWCFIREIFNLFFLNNITHVSVYHLSFFVQGKHPLTAFSDHLEKIRFYVSNLTQIFLFYISHIPPTSAFR